MKSKTIVFCCNSLWGLVNFRGRAIQQLARDGYRVILIAQPDVSRERAIELGADFIPWNVAPRSANPLLEASAIVSLTRLYRQLSPDLAFHYTIKAVLYGAIASRLSATPCISIVTGLGYLFLKDTWKQRFARWLYRRTLRRSQQVWFLNEEDRAFFDSLGLTEGTMVRTLPGEGVNLEHFARAPLPPPAPAFVFLMIARLVKDKGVLEYGDAARKVREIYPHATFRLLGPAYDANAMSVPLSMIEEWKATGQVDYLGAADDVRLAIAQSHCIVLPSYREGMPRVLMEAAAMGRPVITTNVAGCRDMVLDGLTGFMCEPKDSDSLAHACIRMLTLGRDEFHEMSNGAYEQARNRFDDRSLIDTYRSLAAQA